MINKIFLYFNIMQHTINTYEIMFYFTKNIAGHAYLGFLYYDARFPQSFKQLSCKFNARNYFKYCVQNLQIYRGFSRCVV